MHIYTLEIIASKEEQKLLKEHQLGGHAAAAPSRGFLGCMARFSSASHRISGVHGLVQP